MREFAVIGAAWILHSAGQTFKRLITVTDRDWAWLGNLTEQDNSREEAQEAQEGGSLLRFFALLRGWSFQLRLSDLDWNHPWRMFH
jgi:hypothetical protein